jgi:hypothetical protein
MTVSGGGGVASGSPQSSSAERGTMGMFSSRLDGLILVELDGQSRMSFRQWRHLRLLQAQHDAVQASRRSRRRGSGFSTPARSSGGPAVVCAARHMSTTDGEADGNDVGAAV